MSTTTAYTTIVSVQCTCGIVFGLSEVHMANLRRSHATFYCPNGHSQYYPGKSDVEIARQEAESAKANAEYYRKRSNELRAEVDSQKHKVAAERGAKTKLRKRIANGVCPCCKRSFANVARHVAHMHPEEIA